MRTSNNIWLKLKDTAHVHALMAVRILESVSATSGTKSFKIQLTKSKPVF